MTDDRSVSEDKWTTDEIDQEITRSIHYVHNSVDNSLVIDLGRDFEVSFLRIGPRPVAKRLRGVGDYERMTIKFEPDTIEVGRIRLSPSAGLQFAMSMLQRLAEGDHIHAEALREAIDEILTNGPSNEGEPHA